MTKIQVDSNGKAITLGGKALVASEGGVTPTGTLSITQNGTYDVTDYASADVSVSGGGGSAGTRSVYDEINIPFNCQIHSLQNAKLLSGFTMVDKNILPEIDLFTPKAQSSITLELSTAGSPPRPIYFDSLHLAGSSIRGYLLPNATSTNNGTVDGVAYGYNYVRYNSSNDEYVYYDNLNKAGPLSNIKNTSEVTDSIWNFGALKEININGSMSISLNNVEAVLFPNLETACLTRAFFNFTMLKYISFPKLKNIAFSMALGGTTGGGTFYRTQITELRFPSLYSGSFGSYTNQFNYMLLSITGCTVHFPSNLQSVIGSWDSVTTGFGGTNTTVLFDLPATE